MSRIRLQNMTPAPYYMQSRDFQFIGRLYDIVLNSVKTNADMIYYNQLSDNSDERLADLMALTLGFKLKHRYSGAQLKAMCSAFSECIRHKGSLRAVEIAAQTLIHSEGINERFRYTISDDNLTLTAYMPNQLNDLSLFRDVLEYILPAGMICNIVSANFTDASGDTKLTSGDVEEHRSVEAKSRNSMADISSNQYDGILIENAPGYVGTGIISSHIDEAETESKEETEDERQ